MITYDFMYFVHFANHIIDSYVFGVHIIDNYVFGVAYRVCYW